MSRFKLILLGVLAVFALSATLASAAFADAGQEIVNSAGKEAVKKKLTSSGKAGVLKAGTNTVKCQANTGTGELEGTTKVKSVTITFTSCTSEKPGCEAKSVKSKGAKNAGEVVTASLKGALGEVAKGEASSEVGLLLEPTTGTAFVELEKNACTVETKVTGKIACELEPVEKLQTTGNLVCATSGGKQKIKEIETSADTLVKPSLKAFGVESTEEQTDENKFEEEVKVLKGI